MQTYSKPRLALETKSLGMIEAVPSLRGDNDYPFDVIKLTEKQMLALCKELLCELSKEE